MQICFTVHIRMLSHLILKHLFASLMHVCMHVCMTPVYFSGLQMLTQHIALALEYAKKCELHSWKSSTPISNTLGFDICKVSHKKFIIPSSPNCENTWNSRLRIFKSIIAWVLIVRFWIIAVDNPTWTFSAWFGFNWVNLLFHSENVAGFWPACHQ